MNEYDDLVVKLQQQQKALLLVIEEAEEKVKIFQKAISDGKEQLDRVMNMLRMMRPN